MALYAIVNNGVVTDLVSPPDGETISQLTFLTDAQKAAAVAVPSGLVVSRGWTYSGSTFSPPPVSGPPAPSTPAQQAGALLAAGIPVTSNSNSALDATYPVDATTQTLLMAQIVSILLNGTFTDGLTPRPWKDVTGADRSFTVPEFKSFATALAQTIDVLIRIIETNSGTLPATPVQIP